MSKLSKNVMTQIKKRQVKPKARWQFVLWHTLFWVLFVMSIFFGSAVTGLMIHELVFTQWHFIFHMGAYNQILLFIVPMIWLLSLGLLTFLAYQSFLHTKKGYKYHPAIIVLGSILLSVILGSFVHYSQMADRMDRFAGEYFGPYADLQEHIGSVWLEPGENMVAGEIKELVSDTEWILEAYNGEEWVVNLSNLLAEDSNMKADDASAADTSDLNTGGSDMDGPGKGDQGKGEVDYDFSTYEVGTDILIYGEISRNEDTETNKIEAEKLAEFKRGSKGSFGPGADGHSGGEFRLEKRFQH